MGGEGVIGIGWSDLETSGKSKADQKETQRNNRKHDDGKDDDWKPSCVPDDDHWMLLCAIGDDKWKPSYKYVLDDDENS